MNDKEKILDLEQRMSALLSSYHLLVADYEKLKRVITKFEELTYTLEDTGFDNE